MAGPVVIHPDVELWASGFLRTALAARLEAYASGVFVSNAVPSTRRDRMVIVRHDGGPRLDALRATTRLGVNVWAKTEKDATDLAHLVGALLVSAADGSPVVKVTQPGGPIPVADSSGQPLRLMSFEITTRGVQS